MWGRLKRLRETHLSAQIEQVLHLNARNLKTIRELPEGKDGCRTCRAGVVNVAREFRRALWSGPVGDRTL